MAETTSKRNVLIAVDASQDSVRAMEFYLSTVAKPEQDSLLILNSRLLVPMAYPGAGSDYLVAPDVWRELQKQSEAESAALVKKFSKLAFDKNIQFKGESVEGDARDVIIEEAQQNKIDLIILGSRGLGAFKRALLGSVSGHIVNNATCPVLIVREQTNQEEHSSAKRTILFAVDENKCSKDAFRWGLENIVNPETDQIIVMTGHPVSPWPAYPALTTLEMEELIEKKLIDKKKALLLELSDEAKKFGVHCMMEIVRGDAHETILWTVKKYHADLLVVGNRGLNAFSRIFLGSVSNYCCYNAPCPILVVKSPKADVSESPPVVLKVE